MVRVWILAIALAGCGGKKDSSREPPRMITDDEIARYETDLMRRLADNAKRRCERRVLHGNELPGKAGVDLAVFDHPTGNLAKCMTALDELTKAGDELNDRTPKLLDYEQRCGIELEGAIRKATAHVDACSPFQIGQPEPTGLIPYLRVAKVIGLRARLRAENADGVGGLWLIVDAIRMYQDLARGHTTLLVLMISTAATDILVEHAQAILAGPHAPVKLDELAAAIDQLLGTHPVFADVLAAEVEHIALFYGLAPLKPTSWKPPGGWPWSGERPAGPVKAKSFGHERDDNAIMLVVAEALGASLAAACPAAATHKACHTALAKLVRDGAARAKGNEDIGKIFAALARQAATDLDPDDAAAVDALRLKIRGTVVDILQGIATTDFQKYAERHSAAYARLAALRVHVEVLRAKRCPTVAQLDAAPFATPALLGDALVVTEKPGELELLPPKWTKPTRSAWRIPCPK